MRTRSRIFQGVERELSSLSSGLRFLVLGPIDGLVGGIGANEALLGCLGEAHFEH